MGDRLDPRTPGGAEHQRHIYEGEPEEDLISGLEPDQLEAAMDIPFPRRDLSGTARTGLWVLRVLVLTLAAVSVYAFLLQVAHGGTG